MKLKVKIHKIVLHGEIVSVATIEHGPRRPSICEGCPAPCCQSFLRPVLTEEEFKSRKFPTAFVRPEPWLTEQLPEVDYLAVLAFKENGCPYFDHKTHKCKIWPNCPKACLAYDCREDPRPEVQAFVKKRLRRLKRNGNSIH